MEFTDLYFLSKTALKDANNNIEDSILTSIWNNLNTSSLVIFVSMLIFSILAAVYYYTLYNNQPGRHYTPIKWGLIYVIQILIVLIMSGCVVFYFHSQGNYNKVIEYEIRLVIINTLYALLPYIVTSWFWCQFNWPTNAYRFIKF